MSVVPAVNATKSLYEEPARGTRMKLRARMFMSVASLLVTAMMLSGCGGTDTAREGDQGAGIVESAGEAVQSAREATGEAVKSVGESIESSAETVGETAEGATKAVGKAAENVGLEETGQKITDSAAAVGEKAEGATTTTGETIEKAGEVIKGDATPETETP